MGLNKDVLKYFDDKLAEKVGQVVVDKMEESRAKGRERAAKAGITTEQLVERDMAAADNAKLTGEFAIARMARYMWNAYASPGQCMSAVKPNGKPVIEQIKAAGDGPCMQVARVMGGDLTSTGGAMIAPEYSESVIPILFDMSTVRASGATSVPMPSGNLSMPYGDSASTQQWDGESDPITESSPTTGEMSLTARRLTGTTGISNELLADSSGRSDRFIREQLIGGHAEKQDLTLLRSLGVSNEPKGVLYFATDQSQTINSTASATTATISDELADAEYQVEKNKLTIVRGGWIMNPRSLKKLRSARDGNNNRVWADELAGGTLNGYAWKKTTQIPITLNAVGSGSDETEVYFGDWSRYIIGDTQMMEMAVSAEATYYTGSAYVSAFARNESVFRVISRLDTGCQYRGQGFAVIVGVRWGV
jgi:HK97 family phage major capsid protein